MLAGVKGCKVRCMKPCTTAAINLSHALMFYLLVALYSQSFKRPWRVFDTCFWSGV